MTNMPEVVSALHGLEAAAHRCVRISALQGGWFTLPKRQFVSGVPDDEKSLVPSLSFLLTYESSTDTTNSKRVLFDLGLRRNPAHVRQSLRASGLEPDTIDEIILSHVHWDHIGMPSDYPGAKFFVGSGSLKLIKNGLNEHMSHSNFQPDLFNNLDAREFPDPVAHYQARSPRDSLEHAWRSVAGLNILDYSGNGNMYVVDTPGHLTGHISLLVRTGPRRWVLLIGDACHDLRLLTGKASIAEWSDAEGRICCIHMDKRTATKTLGIFRSWKEAAVQGGFDLQIVFAHDADWVRSNPEALFPGAMELVVVPCT
ncbi:hypothetical protein DV736_g6449, partial [Chaetothyriales sp. CBS 134916]